ncbi:MAG: hypothetical protein CVU32_00545 [Betaproteobacteria bacterium HGW-Betaproteobacteria-5]|jgi:peroxiredoxin|nr:MAG: hypothetical protein CVU32_00545 [Betaproteobacteria bacterium HGW-Betaproteobacteria-5]
MVVFSSSQQVNLRLCKQNPSASRDALHDSEFGNLNVSTEKSVSPFRVALGDNVARGVLREIQILNVELRNIRPVDRNLKDSLSGNKVAIFGLSGCYRDYSVKLNNYAGLAEKIVGKVVNEVWVVAIQNPFIVGVWGLQLGKRSYLRLMSDSGANWTSTIGLFDEQRYLEIPSGELIYALIVNDGVVEKILVQENNRALSWTTLEDWIELSRCL